MKKLQLNKEVIARLGAYDMHRLQGGGEPNSSANPEQACHPCTEDGCGGGTDTCTCPTASRDCSTQDSDCGCPAASCTCPDVSGTGESLDPGQLCNWTCASM